MYSVHLLNNSMIIEKTELARREQLWSQGYWEIPDGIDTADFDFTWRPDKHDRPYIHEFGTQWQRTGGPRFVVPQNQGVKYQSGQRATRTPQPEHFTVLVDPTAYQVDFDWSWHPDANEPPFIWIFGNQNHSAESMPTVQYVVPGATEYKYCYDVTATVIGQGQYYRTLIPIDTTTFDYSWSPSPWDPPYIYTWGNPWNDGTVEPTVEYHTPGATERKYMDYRITTLPEPERWHTLIPGATIDLSWRPNPYETPYIYVFGNRWNDAATEPTVEYRVPGATDRKYMTTPVAEFPNTPHDCWQINNELDRYAFDFSWRPNPYAEPQIYQWEDNGPTYTVPGATTVTLMQRHHEHLPVKQYWIDTTLEDLIAQHPHEVFWALNRELNYDHFDFTWRPTSENFRHVNVFGNKLSKDTNTYYVNAVAYNLGQREYNYIEDDSMQIVTEIDMFYVSRGNVDTRYEALLARFPRLQRTRYVSSWIDTINRCIRKAGTRLIWILSSEVDYTDFQFDYYPSSWNRDLIHVFGTQWSQWGNTYIINTETFTESTQHLKAIEHAKNVNLVRTRRTKLADRLYDIVWIDHGNPDNQLDALRNIHPDATITTVKYDVSYLQTLRNYANAISEYEIRREHYVWVCSSMCDYSGFDFTWSPDPFQRENLHVFASKSGTVKQKFGDTFLLNLSLFREIQHDFEQLQEYSKNVNYINYLTVPRLPHPVIEHDYDTQAEAVQHFVERHWPYYELVCRGVTTTRQPVVPELWNSHTGSVIVSGSGASRIFLPDAAIDYVREEVYDYHHIAHLDPLDPTKPLDIVFFSNGEPGADENYHYLLSLGLPNRICRSSDISGRVRSQKMAAMASSTPWYFLVNAKLRVNPDFDWSWQPDRLQKPKHYIFTATNPVNELEYGHQAIVANNRKLTILTGGIGVTVDPPGLDFTMASAHEVVEMNSGIGYYNTDPWTTWRTAFRESIKLRSMNDSVSQERLHAWLTRGAAPNGEWSIRGAQDGVQYWESVDGDMDKLKQSYDWAWIQEQYHAKYGKQ